MWGFHGTTDPNVIDFVNRYHEDKPVVKPNGELIIYPKKSSELPPSENPDSDQLLAENNAGLTDNTFDAADSIFGVADNTLGLADNTLGMAENLFDPADANDVPINLFLEDYA